MAATDWRDALKSLMPDDVLPAEPMPAEEPQQSTPLPLLHIELDRRKGKMTTIIYGFEPDDPRCQDVAKLLRKKLATGGSARAGEILIQGDRKAQCIEILKALGYKINKC